MPYASRLREQLRALPVAERASLSARVRNRLGELQAGPLNADGDIVEDAVDRNIAQMQRQITSLMNQIQVRVSTIRVTIVFGGEES